MHNWTKTEEFKFKRRRKAKGAHPAYSLLAKLKKVPRQRIRDLLPKKSLLKFITQFYTDRMHSLDPSQSFVEFVYDALTFKFGLNNVSEKKFSQVSADPRPCSVRATTTTSLA